MTRGIFDGNHPVTTLEETNLHMAALQYARARFRPLEVRARVDRAQQVLHLLEERDPTTDREFFQRDELDACEELARLTLLHAGEHLLSPPNSKPTHVESLLFQICAIVQRAQSQFSSSDRTLGAAVMAFNEIVGLVASCSRMAGDPPCARDGECPEHGRDRPGQCVPESGTGHRGPDTGVGSSP